MLAARNVGTDWCDYLTFTKEQEKDLSFFINCLFNPFPTDKF